MACPNFKNGPKNGLGPLGVNKDALEGTKIVYYKYKNFVFINIMWIFI
jgi:hypothetical protein